MNEELEYRISRISQKLSEEMSPEGQCVFINYSMIDLDENHEVLYQQWQDHCASLVTPGTHTLDEMVDWLKTMYDIEPMQVDPNAIHTKIYASNLQARHFQQSSADEPSPLDDMTAGDMAALSDEQLAEMLAQSYRQALADSTPSPFEIDVTALNLSIKAYRFPQTERNNHLYEAYRQQERESLARMRQKKPHLDWTLPEHCEQRLNEMQIELYTEENTGDWELQSPLNHNILFQQILLYIGVSQQDIDERNTKFLNFISHQSSAGDLPTFEAFQEAIKTE